MMALKEDSSSKKIWPPGTRCERDTLMTSHVAHDVYDDFDGVTINGWLKLLLVFGLTRHSVNEFVFCRG